MMVEDERLQQFVALSAELTAFSAFDLRGTGQAKAYFSTVLEQVGEQALGELLDVYQRIAGAEADAEQRSGLLNSQIFGNALLGPVAGNIIRLWYAGIWYELPVEITESFAERETGPAIRKPPFVVSPAAYTEGLLWRAIGAHPTGAKAQGYGAWAEPPIIEGHPDDRQARTALIPRQAEPDRAETVQAEPGAL